MGDQSFNLYLWRPYTNKLMSKNKIHNEPGRCINCDTAIRKEKLQCWFCERNHPIKKKNKKKCHQ